MNSPVPQHETYRKRSSRERLMSVTSGGTALKPLQQRRQLFRIGRLGGNFDHFPDRPFAVLAVVLAIPHPDRRRKIFQRNHHADETVSLVGIVRRPQFQHHLLLRTQIEFLQMTALGQIPDVQLVAVFAGQQHLRIHALLSPCWAFPIRW